MDRGWRLLAELEEIFQIGAELGVSVIPFPVAATAHENSLRRLIGIVATVWKRIYSKRAE
jgi:hypothetical protein